jgi:hypothetical protein
VLKLPEDGRVVLKHFRVLKVCNFFILYVHLVGFFKNQEIKLHVARNFIIVCHQKTPVDFL